MDDVYGALQWQLARALSETGHNVALLPSDGATPRQDHGYTLTIELIRLDLASRGFAAPLEPPAISEFILGFWAAVNRYEDPDSRWRKFFYFHKEREFKFDIMGTKEQELRLIDDSIQEAAAAVVSDPQFQSAVLSSGS